MTTVDKFLGLAIFLMMAPIALIALPETAAIVSVAVFGTFYFVHIWKKPQRRCRSCGEIFRISLFGSLKVRVGHLNCPRCGTQVKNKHR